MPIFARVSHTEYHPEQPRVEATVIQHEALAADVDAVAMTRGAQFNMAEPWSHKSRLASTRRQSGREGLETGSLGDARDDQIQIRLGHRRLGLIQENSDFIRNLITITVRNNLYQALQRFCPPAYLEQLLLRPHDVAAKKGLTMGAYLNSGLPGCSHYLGFRPSSSASTKGYSPTAGLSSAVQTF